MKIRFYFMIGALIAVLFASCKKDNYDAPQADFTGRIVYKGEPISVQYGQVNFELWQSGFGNYAALNVNVSQDGTYSARLFNGDYKLVFSPNQGPFLWKNLLSYAAMLSYITCRKPRQFNPDRIVTFR